MQLITYFAEDGDIVSSSPASSDKTPYSSPKHQAEQQLVNVEPQDDTNLSKSEHEYINAMLTDAMKESELEEGRSSKLIFFFFNT